MLAVRPALARVLARSVPGCPYARLFAAWLVLRTALWAAVSASQPNLPLDAVELLGFGNAWLAGYPQHPPVPAWAAAAFARLAPDPAVGLAVGGLLATALCLLAVWRVARAYLPPAAALVAVAALDGLKFLSWDATEWNNNVALNVGAALTVWFGLRAVQTRAIGWWVLVGAAAGLSLLSKYTAAFHFAPLALYLVATPAGRRCLRTPGPYAATAVAAALFAPHLVWVANNDYVTLRYAAARAADAGGWSAHALNPVIFLATQALILAPAVFVLWPLVGKGGEARADAWYLRAAAGGPVLLFVAYAAATGSQLRDAWGSTYWTFATVWLLAERGAAAPDAGALRRATRRWALVALTVPVLFLVKQAGEPFVEKKPTRAHFPGRPLAAELGAAWDAEFGVPFRTVAGEPWLAGNVACYAPQRPALHSDWSVGYLTPVPGTRPWNSDAAVNAHGGVLIWNADVYGDAPPPALLIRFPAATGRPPRVVPYQTAAAVAPLRVGVAFVPPAR